MRELTQKEIDQAPAGSTHYFINLISGKPHFYDHNFVDECQPIPRKEFDINEHNFFNLDYIKINRDGDIDFVIVDGHGGQVDGMITKQDSIALAKHFGHHKGE